MNFFPHIFVKPYTVWVSSFFHFPILQKRKPTLIHLCWYFRPWNDRGTLVVDYSGFLVCLKFFITCLLRNSWKVRAKLNIVFLVKTVNTWNFIAKVFGHWSTAHSQLPFLLSYHTVIVNIIYHVKVLSLIFTNYLTETTGFHDTHFLV